jgi:hypothetical protein
VASLVAQTLGVLAASAVLVALASRAGIRVALPVAAALAAVLLLAVLAVANYREGWHTFDVQRQRFSHVTEKQTRVSCAGATGVDLGFLAWAAGRIPTRERYFPVLPHRLVSSNGDFCIRLVMLPRIATRTLPEAHYVLLWGVAPAAVGAGLRRRGARIETYKPGYGVARLP